MNQDDKFQPRKTYVRTIENTTELPKTENS